MLAPTRCPKRARWSWHPGPLLHNLRSSVARFNRALGGHPQKRNSHKTLLEPCGRRPGHAAFHPLQASAFKMLCRQGWQPDMLRLRRKDSQANQRALATRKSATACQEAQRLLAQLAWRSTFPLGLLQQAQPPLPGRPSRHDQTTSVPA